MKTNYNVVFVTPMGSPISAFFADLVMEDLEVFSRNILKIEFNCISICYFRYVDDSIRCIKRNHIYILNKVFNKFDFNLNFTYRRLCGTRCYLDGHERY